MRIPPVAVAIVAIALPTAALADPEGCSVRPTGQWIPIETAIERAESLGYVVDEAKRTKGCWKIEGYDRHGAEIEIHLDAVSGDVVKPRRWRSPPSR
jgi:hypothetical protein